VSLLLHAGTRRVPLAAATRHTRRHVVGTREARFMSGRGWRALSWVACWVPHHAPVSVYTLRMVPHAVAADSPTETDLPVPVRARAACGAVRGCADRGVCAFCMQARPGARRWQRQRQAPPGGCLEVHHLPARTHAGARCAAWLPVLLTTWNHQQVCLRNWLTSSTGGHRRSLFLPYVWQLCRLQGNRKGACCPWRGDEAMRQASELTRRASRAPRASAACWRWTWARPRPS